MLDLPGIGEGIARSINEYIMTGRMSRLDSLQVGHDPINLFEQIPGIDFKRQSFPLCMEYLHANLSA